MIAVPYGARTRILPLPDDILARAIQRSLKRNVILPTYEEMAHPGKVLVLNQFDEFGNAVRHYVCTGQAIQETFAHTKKQGQGSPPCS